MGEDVTVTIDGAISIIRLLDLMDPMQSNVAETAFRTYRFLLNEPGAISCVVDFGSPERNGIAQRAIEKGEQAMQKIKRLVEES